jgi:ArsR family transcriptional regulator
VLRTRDEAGSWVDTVAGQMERHYSPGRTWEATTRGLLGFLRLGDVLDLGCGDGVVASLVKERARSLTCLDRSARALAAARERLGADPLVTFVEGDMEALPLPSASFDQVLLLHVLTCTRDPAQALAEAARVLRPGARLCVVTLAEHHHADLVAAFDHLHCGFSPSGLRQLLGAAGLTVETCEVTSRERRQPYFEVLTAVASRPGDGP